MPRSRITGKVFDPQRPSPTPLYGWQLHTRLAFMEAASASFDPTGNGISGTLQVLGMEWALRNYGNGGGGTDFLDGLNIKPGEGLQFELSRTASYRDSQQDGPSLYIQLENLPNSQPGSPIGVNIGPSNIPVRIAATLTNLGSSGNQSAGIGVLSSTNIHSDGINSFIALTGHLSGSRHASWAGKSTSAFAYPTSPPAGIFDAIMVEQVGTSAVVYWGSASADGTPPDVTDPTKWFRDSGSTMGIGNQGGQGGFGTVSNARMFFMHAQNGGDTTSTFKPIFMYVDIYYMAGFSLGLQNG